MVLVATPKHIRGTNELTGQYLQFLKTKSQISLNNWVLITLSKNVLLYKIPFGFKETEDIHQFILTIIGLCASMFYLK